MFTEAHVAAYREDAEFLDYMVTEDIESAGFTKGLEIRGMAPRLGPP